MEFKVDTRTQRPAEIGHQMWVAAGDIAIDEAVEAWGSLEMAAQAVADFHEEFGNRWVDYDGEVLDVVIYVLDYISD